MQFVAGLRPCAACGDHRPIAWQVGGRDATWILRGACNRCATQQTYAFHCDRDPLASRPAPRELGGPAPSTVIGPRALVAEIDRLMPAIAVRPGTLIEPAWSANWARLERLRTAFNELAKFVVGDEIPVDGDAALDQRQRPERYTRAWIDDERARWAAVAALLAPDFARIAAADPILSRPTPPRGRLDELALRNHAAWLARGRSGLGRLELVTSDACGRTLEGANLSASHLEGVLFARAELEVARFDGATLIDVDFAHASLAHASFAEASLRGCAFDHARLQTTRWRAATLDACRLRDGLLVDAQLERATLVGCDLRGTSLRGALAAGAVLDGCDLRGAVLTGADLAGATLRHCRIAGARGAPSSTDGWTVIDADFSDLGDGSDLGDAEDVLAELCAT